MPNHVTTIVEAPKEVIDFLFVDGHVDFNSVIPMPEDDDPIFTATKTVFGGGMVGYSMDGYSPMEWGIGNWGTKWNAYEGTRLDDTSVQFDTAWSHPFPVIEALSVKFPEAVITVKYADEDLGSNLGWYVILGGGITGEDAMVSGSEEALEFACQIKYSRSYAEQVAEWEEEEAEWKATYEARLAGVDTNDQP